MVFVTVLVTASLLRLNSAYPNCSLSTIDNGTKSDARILSAYSTAMGTEVNLSYYDTGQLLGAKYLFPGSMRFPGGGVANYWNYSNASYVTPCKTSDYDRCNPEYNIDQWPVQTFTAKNFAQSISSASALNESKIKEAHSLVFDMNLLTLSGQQMLQQVDVLKSQIPTSKLKHLELGNEYYISKKYNWSIPNSTYYMQKALPSIKKIRSDIPDGKIAIVSDRPITADNATQTELWNDGIAAYKSGFDAVTIHDYSCYKQMHNDKHQNGLDEISYIMIYGQSVVPQYAQYVRSKFGNDKTIWMTEYNWATENHFNDTMNFRAVHTIFSLGYIAAGVCDDTVEILMWYIWNSQVGSGGNSIGYSYPQMLMYNSEYSNDINNTYYDIGGQIMAHFGWISMVKNDRMYCLNVDAECPQIGIDVVSKQLQCVYGIGFGAEEDDNSFGFAIINACQYEVGLTLQLKEMINLSTDVTVDIWWYLWNDRFDGNIGIEKFIDCDEGKNLWECGKYRPGYSKMNVSKSMTQIQIVLKPLSLTLGASA